MHPSISSSSDKRNTLKRDEVVQWLETFSQQLLYKVTKEE